MVRNRGFTLIEMLVVVSLIGIALRIAIPAFQETIQTNRAQAINEQLRDALLSARQEAISRNELIFLELNTEQSGSVNWRVGCVTERSSCPAQIKQRQLLKNGSNFSLQTTPSTATRVVFSPIGTRQANPDTLSRVQMANNGTRMDIAVGIGGGGIIKSCKPASHDYASYCP